MTLGSDIDMCHCLATWHKQFTPRTWHVAKFVFSKKKIKEPQVDMWHVVNNIIIFFKWLNWDTFSKVMMQLKRFESDDQIDTLPPKWGPSDWLSLYPNNPLKHLKSWWFNLQTRYIPDRQSWQPDGLVGEFLQANPKHVLSKTLLPQSSSLFISSIIFSIFLFTQDYPQSLILISSSSPSITISSSLHPTYSSRTKQEKQTLT